MVSKFSILIVVLLLACLFSACERDTQVTISGGDRPTFELSGSGRMERFEILGPTGSVWAVMPDGTGNQVGRIGTIKYGEVPSGYKQISPEKGPPPYLVEGKTYYLSVDTQNANGRRIQFVIQNGKAIEKPGTANGNVNTQ